MDYINTFDRPDKTRKKKKKKERDFNCTILYLIIYLSTHLSQDPILLQSASSAISHSFAFFSFLFFSSPLLFSPSCRRRLIGQSGWASGCGWLSTETEPIFVLLSNAFHKHW